MTQQTHKRQKVMDALRRVRTIALSRLVETTALDFTSTADIVKALANESVVRIAVSKGCGGSCSGCTVCTTVGNQALSPTDIIVSFIYDRGQDHDDF